MLNAAEYHQKRLIFFGFITLLLLHTIFVFTGFYNNDDIVYARYAASIAKNGIPFGPATNQYQLRWTTVYFAAFFFKLLGINTFATTLFSFFSTVLCGAILKKVLQDYDPLIYLLSLTAFFFCHSILFYMHRLLPDSAMCLAVFWMYTSYRNLSANKQSQVKKGLHFSAGLLLAILTKETIIIVLPLFIAFFVLDLLKRRRMHFWLVVMAASFFGIGLYLLYFKLTTGSFFYRYNVLQLRSYFSECSFDQLPLSFTLKRIGYGLWNAMLLNGDLLVLLPATTAFIYRKKITAFTGVRNIDFFAFLFLLLAANFMTTSFTKYIPLCQDPRHFLFLFPFAALIAGPLLYAYFKEPLKFLLLPAFLVVATIAIFYVKGGTTKYLYLLFSIILIARLVLKYTGSKCYVKIFITSFVSLSFISYIIEFIRPPFPYYFDHKKIVEKNIAGNNLTGKLFSADAFSGEITEFFLQFNTGSLQVLPMDSVKPVNHGNLYYLLVGDINPAAKSKIDSLALKKTGITLVLIDRVKNVSLYKLSDATLQMLK